MTGLFLSVFLLMMIAVTTIIYGQNSTGENKNITLSCIREFYSDKGYGEDVTEFCKK